MGLRPTYDSLKGAELLALANRWTQQQLFPAGIAADTPVSSVLTLRGSSTDASGAVAIYDRLQLHTSGADPGGGTFNLVDLSTPMAWATAGQAYRILNVTQVITIGANPATTTLFSANFTFTNSGTPRAFGTLNVLSAAPIYTPAAGTDVISTASFRGLFSTPTYSAFTTGTGASAFTYGLQASVTLNTGWTLAAVAGVKVTKLGGVGGVATIHVGVDIDDLTDARIAAGGVASIRSVGLAVPMKHAGPALIGAVGAPNTPLGLDVAGDLSTRSSTLALVNGANNDIAIGNSSLVLITGPTAAFNITSIASPQNGKRLVLVNLTAFAMTLTNASAAGGTAANRILSSTLADLVGTATHPTTAELVYDATTLRWRDVNFRP